MLGVITVVSAVTLIFAGAIGHGPSSPGKVTSVIMLLLAALFAIGSVHPRARIGAAFIHGKAGTVPISRVGRIIAFLTALLLVIAGVKGLLK
jgi:hypothetical protein